MSIKLEFSKGSLRTEVVLKDEALGALMELFAKFETNAAPDVSPKTKGQPAATPESGNRQPPTPSGGDDQISSVKNWLVSHTASEVLNVIKWHTHPDKLLLLAAYHEANGGPEGWKSADIEERFDQAKESFPKNFPREIRTTVEDGVVGAVTPRTYKVGRAGWNKIAEAIAKLS